MTKNVILSLCLISLLWLAACASPNHVVDEYQEYSEKHVQKKSSRTVILFLVDGLPVTTITEEISTGSIPEIQHFFIGQKKSIYQARSSFPSLTFPAIGSLLSQSTVDKHGIYGNLVLDDEEIVNYEDPQNFSKANLRIQHENIFSRLESRGYKTVSLDYSFNANAGVGVQLADANAAAAILQKNYFYVDKSLLSSLEELLSKTKPEQWPDFIYVHLVGIDFTSHDQGPDSLSVRQYLQKLDHELKDIFSLLTDAEKNQNRQIITMLTADHGFDQTITHNFDLERALHDARMRILNEGRLAGLYFPQDWSQDMRSTFLQEWANKSEIDIVAARSNDKVEIFRRKEVSTVQYVMNSLCPQQSFALIVDDRPQRCADHLDELSNQKFYPFFISNLSHYFQADGHPDAVLIAKPGISFHTNSGLGQHGGPTERELFVPLLMRGAELKDPSRIPSLSKLLEFMTKEEKK